MIEPKIKELIDSALGISDKVKGHLGFKGFDSELCCRDFQFVEGKKYIHEGDISLCYSGFHYSPKLSQAKGYYFYAGSKFAIVSAEGKILCGGDKNVTSEITILHVLNEEEIEYIDKYENERYLSEQVYCLDIVRELQSRYNMIIGGSTSLYIYGIPLERGGNGKQSDLDIIMPYYQKILPYDKIGEIVEVKANSSGSDYKSTFLVYAKDGRFVKIDVRIDNNCKYDIVTKDGFNYKCCDLMSTIEAKARYAMEGGVKHRDDLMHLLKVDKEIINKILTRDEEVCSG